MSKDLALEKVEWDLHENPETFIPLEFTEEIKPEIFGLEVAKATEMVSGLSTTITEREVLKKTYVDVIELEINKTNLPIFKELRLKFVKNRTSIENWHKKNKAFYLAGGRFVDAIKNKEIAENKEIESKLLEAEKFFENLEKQKAKDLNDARIERIRPFVDDVTGFDFAPMNDEDFDDYLLGKKTRFENAKTEAEAELVRIETERLAEIENNRRRLAIAPYLQFSNTFSCEISELSKEEYEVLLTECQHAKIEFDKEQGKIKAENAKLKADAKELQDKKAIESAKLEAERKEAERLAKAPIKHQLEVWVSSFQNEIPEQLRDNEIANEILSKFWSFKSWANNQINQL